MMRRSVQGSGLRLLAASLVLIAASSAPPANPPRQASAPGGPQGTATVTVEVADETGKPVANQSVGLIVHDGAQIVDELSAATAADGTARFSDVPTGEGYQVRAVATFAGYPYQGEPTPLPAGVDLALPVTVYNTHQGGADLHIQMVHIVLNAVEPGFFQAIQLIEVLNVGELATLGGPMVDGNPSGAVIPVPSLASNVAPLANLSGLDVSRLAVDGGNLLDLRPVPPGSHQFAIRYELVTGAAGSDVEITLPYPTNQLSLLVGPDLEDVEISSLQLAPGAPQEIPGQGVYANWTSDVLGAGESLVFHIGPADAPLSIAAWSLIAVGLALLAGSAAAAFGGRAPALDDAGRRRVIRDLARLDDQFEAGDLSAADHYAQRSSALQLLGEFEAVSDAAPDAGGE